MTILAAGSALFALLAVFFLLRAGHCLRRGRILRASSSGISCIASTGVAALGAIVLLSYLSYTRLVDEQPVSRILFNRLSPDEYQARLMISGELDRFFVLRGDEWQLDARIVTWKAPMTVLGLDPIFKLDRLSGRYADINREQSQLRTVHALAANGPTDLWQFAHRFPFLLPGVDAHYGTATYVPMADGAKFNVSLSRDALIARPANDSARKAVGAWNGN
ncbi:MAG: cation/multidrug efflux pump [Woeseiaceae bacterium]